MLKGLNKINKYLNTWLKENGFDCKVRIGTDFGYCEDSDTIEYCFVIPENDSIIFNEVCKDYNKNFPSCDPFIISFFHELGHFETQGIFSEQEWSSYFNLCDKLRTRKKLTEKDYRKYYLHPIEYEATTWAIDYILNNKEKIYDWWNNLQPLILNFYELNNIEDI